MSNYSHFAALDIRVGKIVAVDDFPKARNPAYILTIDLGEIGQKKSSAQITNLYSKEDLIGKQVVCIVNFPPKQIANFFSEVLVLGADNEKGIILLKPEREAELGDRIC